MPWEYFGYKTKHEVAFIQSLGSYKTSSVKITHIERLKRYRAGMMRRDNWEGIDKRVCFALIDAKIAAEE